MINLENIYQALFLRVKDLPGLVTSSRRPRLPQDVAPEEMPALFQEQLPIGVQHQAPGLPPQFMLRADLALYVAAPPLFAAASSLLNPLIIAVGAALEPDPGDEDQTLGGLVQYCRLGSDIEINEGIITGTAVAVIPVEMLAV